MLRRVAEVASGSRGPHGAQVCLCLLRGMAHVAHPRSSRGSQSSGAVQTLVALLLAARGFALENGHESGNWVVRNERCRAERTYEQGRLVDPIWCAWTRWLSWPDCT